MDRRRSKTNSVKALRVNFRNKVTYRGNIVSKKIYVGRNARSTLIVKRRGDRTVADSVYAGFARFEKYSGLAENECRT
jgi:hypothetical protein